MACTMFDKVIYDLCSSLSLSVQSTLIKVNIFSCKPLMAFRSFHIFMDLSNPPRQAGTQIQFVCIDKYQYFTNLWQILVLISKRAFLGL